ncbi:MAG: OPT/YSL family transporter [Gemmatimonadales bacterium]
MTGLHVEEYEVRAVPARHPSPFEPTTLLLGVLVALLGAVIGLELLTRVGITPNSSIIGAIIAMAVARIPLSLFRAFASVPRQNLLQTVISGATFGGANALLLPMGVLWLVGEVELVPVMMLGALMGLVLDAAVLYRLFDSRIYPARELWPSGVATAECIIAGDRGGQRAKLLGAGGLVGGVGQYLGIPMDVFGVCWIGNMWALTMFGVGLLVRGYAPAVAGVDLEELYIPHGIMIGAGSVALFQIVAATRSRADDAASGPSLHAGARRVRGGLAFGFVGFAAAASVMAVLAGLYAEMSPPMLVAFVIFAAVAALGSELVVGISAMHAGWFPAFATALIFLVLGMLVGFPPLPLAFLVGFTASTGPAFADMGYDLKAGWILRGRGAHAVFERQGRRQQFLAEMLGFGVAAVIVLLFHGYYFSNELFPPVDRVYAATIAAGTDPALAGSLLLWVLPGAVVQLLGGPARQLGILFATGLLIYNPVAGWTALVSLAIRVVLIRKFGGAVQSPMYVLAGGFIAGSALTSFGTATVRAR